MRAALGQAALTLARALWRASPRALRDAFGLAVGARLRDGLAAGVRSQAWSSKAPSPIVVSAFFQGATGVAAGGRATAALLEAAGFQVLRHDLGGLLDAGGFQAHDLPGDPNGVWLIHANPPEAKLALARLRRCTWEHRYRIGFWAWELPRAPADWIAAAAGFHEVWAPSRFVRDSLSGSQTRLVLRPHALPDVQPIASDRPHFGIEDGAVTFLCMADLKSGLRRKNPLGAVEAYRRAFPEARMGVALVVKVHSAAAEAEALSTLEQAIRGRSDIHVLDGRLSHGDALRLIASCDVLLSLHRSEGFGLPIAEALMLGRAVLATGWSGSEEFLGGVAEARLPYSLVPVVDPGGVYDDPSQVWAEPDLEAAARRIGMVARDPSLRSRIASQGAAAVADLAEAWSKTLLSAEPWAAAVSRGIDGRPHGEAPQAEAFPLSPRAMAASDETAQEEEGWATARTLAEALPFISRYDRETVVIKYGGHAMGEEAVAKTFAADAVLLKLLGVHPVVVHGGGPQISRMLERSGVTSNFIDGLRVTDEATMEVAEMVLSGSINKDLVNYINLAGKTADVRGVGLSGKDARLITVTKARRARKDPDSEIEEVVDLGFVGEPKRVDPQILLALIHNGQDQDYVPVIAPIGVSEEGQTYNINADTAAGAVAGALRAKRMLLLTDVKGVLDREGHLIRQLTVAQAFDAIRSGVATGGMIPKLETAIAAVDGGVEAVVIMDGRRPHAMLLELFTEHGAGTLIKA